MQRKWRRRRECHVGTGAGWSTFPDICLCLWNSKCRVRSETSGLAGVFLVKISCWHRPRGDMVARTAPRASQPIPCPAVSAYQPLAFLEIARCQIPPWHTVNSVCTLVFNDKGRKLTMGPLPHPLVTP